MQLQVEVQAHSGGPCRAGAEEAHDSMLRSIHDRTTNPLYATE